MNKFFIFYVIFIIIYAGAFLRHIPRIDVAHSGFGISCDENINAFKEISGANVNQVSGTGKSVSYAITNPDWDVAAKTICNEGTPIDPQKFIANIRSIPNYMTVSADRTNYTVVLTRAEYMPSVFEYAMLIIVMFTVIGFIELFRRV